MKTVTSPSVPLGLGTRGGSARHASSKKIGSTSTSTTTTAAAASLSHVLIECLSERLKYCQVSSLRYDPRLLQWLHFQIQVIRIIDEELRVHESLKSPPARNHTWHRQPKTLQQEQTDNRRKQGSPEPPKDLLEWVIGHVDSFQ